MLLSLYIIDVLSYGVKSFPYIKEAGYCSCLAVNTRQDIGFEDKHVVFNQMTCSIGELQIWDSIVAIAVLMDDEFDGSLEDFGTIRKERILILF